MFRFTIRDVLWLAVVVALTVGWGIEHRQLKATLASAQEVKREATGWEASNTYSPMIWSDSCSVSRSATCCGRGGGVGLPVGGSD